MRDFVKRIVNWFITFGICFPLITLLIGKTIFPPIPNSKLTFILWPKAKFVFENIVQSADQKYPPSEVMKFYGLAILSNAMLYLFLGIFVGVVLWFVRRIVGVK